MESHEIFLLLLLVGFGMFLAKQMMKSIATVLGITITICFLYLIFSGQANRLVNPGVQTVFDKNDVFSLYDLYCCADCVERERTMCSCFIGPVYNEVLDRIPHEKTDYYNDNRDLLKPITQRVLDQNKANIDYCIEVNQTTRFKIIQDIENVIELYRKSKEMRNGGGGNHHHIRA